MKIRNPQTTYNAKKYLPSTLFTNTSAVVSSKMGFEKPKQNRLKRNDSLVRREAQYNKKNNTLRKAYWTRLLHKQRAQWLVKFGGPGSAPIELHDRSRRSWQPAHTQLSVTRSRPNNFVLFRQAAHNALRTVRSQLNPVNSIRADVACAMQPALLQFAPFIRSNQALVFCRLTAGEQQSSLIFAKKSRELAYFRSAQLRVKAKRIVSGQ